MRPRRFLLVLKHHLEELDYQKCQHPVEEGKRFRQCKRWVREVVGGRGYCYPHAKMVKR